MPESKLWIDDKRKEDIDMLAEADWHDPVYNLMEDIKVLKERNSVLQSMNLELRRAQFTPSQEELCRWISTPYKAEHV